MSDVKIATRESYGNALAELGKVNPDVVVFDADLAGATKTGVFKKAFPDRHFDCGIAESNMVGIAAGIATLTETAGISLDDIQTLYIAGGFGSHLNVESAAAIGLIPDVLKDRVDILGNASLAGAVSALLDTHQWQNLSEIASSSSRVDLGGNPRFNEHYIDHMLFE